MNPVEINEQGVTAAQARVLATLRDAGRALTLTELQHLTGLHANTLRGHLDALVAGGNASRIASRSGGRGRPAWSYLAREPEYAALAMALASGLDQGAEGGSTDPRTLDPAAVEAVQADIVTLKRPDVMGGGGGDGIVVLEVVYDDGSIQAALDEIYGPGAVHVTSWLR